MIWKLLSFLNSSINIFLFLALDLIERRQASQASQQSQDGEVSVENKTEDLSGDNNFIEKAFEEEIEKSVESETVVTSETEVNDVDDKFKRLNLFFEQEKARTADVASRQEYLRQQRDKILQIKKQARARQLYETNKERPKSAAAAQKIIDGEKIEAEKDVEKVRKMLAKKLRDEVVNNTAGHSETSEET